MATLMGARRTMSEKIHKPEAEGKEQLTPEHNHVRRQKGTERAFTGEYYDEKTPGKYTCVCCGQELFSSEAKYESGTGWPSFYQPVADENVDEETDTTHGMRRTEVRCSRCD